MINQLNKQVQLIRKRINNVYMIDLDLEIRLDASCLVSLNKDSWIWHKKHAYASMDLIGKLSRKDLVVNLPKLNHIKDGICDACQNNKEVNSFFQSKKIVFTTKHLDLLLMNLIRLSRIKSYRGNSLILVIINDYSRFT